MKKRMGIVAVTATVTLVTTPAVADSPARERELACSDGTVSMGQQVRLGQRQTPARVAQRSPGRLTHGLLSFHAASISTPDGTVVEEEIWDHASGVDQNHDLVVCSFVIPIGLTGHAADFVGFFVPGSS